MDTGNLARLIPNDQGGFISKVAQKFSFLFRCGWQGRTIIQGGLVTRRVHFDKSASKCSPSRACRVLISGNLEGDWMAAICQELAETKSESCQEESKDRASHKSSVMPPAGT